MLPIVLRTTRSWRVEAGNFSSTSLLLYMTANEKTNLPRQAWQVISWGHHHSILSSPIGAVLPTALSSTLAVWCAIYRRRQLGGDVFDKVLYLARSFLHGL